MDLMCSTMAFREKPVETSDRRWLQVLRVGQFTQLRNNSTFHSWSINLR